ncbi:MAG: MoaD/ThiS family protein [Gemmataceae bacterium]|jgi:molybdopterin converting factor small subunit|nr:MoaD/ThiS family protein [Gemmataceae bacterium]
MAVKIEIPSPLREFTGGLVDVPVTASTVKEALNSLVEQYPNIGPKLFDNGKIRPYINIFVNDEDIRYLDEMETTVADGQTIALVPAVAGG